ncbi:alpha/beta hydrolase [Roseivivax sp. CAU 1753]
MSWVGYVAAAVGLTFAVALWLAPKEPVRVDAVFDEARLADGVDGYLRATEAQVDGIRPGTEKRVVWAGASETRTDWAVVYLHGFSASAEEIRPVPDRVAEALGANLYFARLPGHGQDGDALAGASLPDWMADVAEALAIGRAIGDRVLIIATSTGASLATIAAHDPRMSGGVAGIAMVSPNFRVRNRAATILTWPGVRLWGPLVAGRERGFEPVSEAHRAHWTTRYPTVALLPMAESVRIARGLPHGDVDVPALMVFSDRDQVVDAGVTRDVAAAWGGPVEIMQVDAERTEPQAHVIAGDLLSPEMTDPVASRIVDWARKLP